MIDLFFLSMLIIGILILGSFLFSRYSDSINWFLFIIWLLVVFAAFGYSFYQDGYLQVDSVRDFSQQYGGFLGGGEGYHAVINENYNLSLKFPGEIKEGDILCVRFRGNELNYCRVSGCCETIEWFEEENNPPQPPGAE